MAGVAELEAQLAFVEDTVSALDSALAAQQQHIMKLEQELELLRAFDRAGHASRRNHAPRNGSPASSLLRAKSV